MSQVLPILPLPFSNQHRAAPQRVEDEKKEKKEKPKPYVSKAPEGDSINTVDEFFADTVESVSTQLMAQVIGQMPENTERQASSNPVQASLYRVAANDMAEAQIETEMPEVIPQAPEQRVSHYQTTTARNTASTQQIAPSVRDSY